MNFAAGLLFKVDPTFAKELQVEIERRQKLERVAERKNYGIVM